MQKFRMHCNEMPSKSSFLSLFINQGCVGPIEMEVQGSDAPNIAMHYVFGQAVFDEHRQRIPMQGMPPGAMPAI